MGRLRKWVVPLSAVGLALAVAGCGSSSSATSTTQSSYNTMTVPKLADGAAKEGSVTWYVAIGEDDVQPIVAAFNKTYPHVKVNALRLSADEIPSRVMTEQKGGKFNADVVTGDALQVVQLVHAKALQPYDPPDAAPLPAGLSLPKGFGGVAYANTTVIAYNPTIVKKLHLPTPRTWEDLTAPAWKGHFTVDPGAVNWYDSLITSMGHDRALALMKAIGANRPVPVESHSQALDDITAGEPAAGATIYGYMASPLKRSNPSQMDFVNPNPLPVSLNLTDLGAKAPHPAAARLFDDWLVSQKGQQAIVSLSDDTSLRPDVKNDATVWDPTTWKPSWSNPTLSPSAYNSELAEMKNALHVQ